jgi:hypothetical protein
MKSLNWTQINKLIELHITTERRHLKQNDFKAFVKAVLEKASAK